MTEPPDNPTAELASRLRLVIARASRRLRQEGGGSLSPSATAALATVDRHGPLTPSRLAELERIQRPTATRVVARLEEAGLLDRAADPDDARSSVLRVSARGRELLRRQRTRRTAFLARWLETLPSGQRKTLQDAAAILEGMLDAPRA
jgi:DNA-binding MarR family transcriptional regulator